MESLWSTQSWRCLSGGRLGEGDGHAESISNGGLQVGCQGTSTWSRDKGNPRWLAGGSGGVFGSAGEGRGDTGRAPLSKHRPRCPRLAGTNGYHIGAVFCAFVHRPTASDASAHSTYKRPSNVPNTDPTSADVLIARLDDEVSFRRDQRADTGALDPRNPELAAGRQQLEVLYREAVIWIPALAAGDGVAVEPSPAPGLMLDEGPFEINGKKRPVLHHMKRHPNTMTPSRARAKPSMAHLFPTGAKPPPPTRPQPSDG